MKRIPIAIMAAAILLHACSLLAQVDSVMYSPDFEFVNGIYRTFEEFKNNDPSIKEIALIPEHPIDQVIDIDIDLWDFLAFGSINTAPLFSTTGDFLKNKKIVYRDKDGEIGELKAKEVWGYSSDRNVYVMKDQHFNKVFQIGAIMHFAAKYYDPLHLTGNSAGYVQHLIDFKTGELLSYSFVNFFRLLKGDEALYEEFTAIKGNRKKKQKMLMYLIKYNKRNPIYFPVRQ